MSNLSKISIPFLLFALVFMGFFAPLRAKASFFSSIFGDEVSASTDTLDSPSAGTNSQNMALLLANVSSVSIKENSDKNVPTGSSDQSYSDDTANILSSNALVPATGLLRVSDGTEIIDSSSDQVSVYVIRKGDSLSAIADMFGVSVNTILLANDMKKNDKLVPGTVLVILPISGIEHTITKGQTLKSIAKLYKVDVIDITSYNGINEDAKLLVGDKLMIPGADNMADEGGDKPAQDLGKAMAKDKNYYDTHPIQSLLGYFINPVPTGHKTQGLHGPGNRAIDIGAPTGTPIYASASGAVLVVKTGCVVGKRLCGGSYGNMIIMDHLNGTKTLYAHMTKVATRTGAEIAQGEVIGYVGSTGRSTGPHLHFEVFNAKNPGADWSWKN